MITRVDRQGNSMRSIASIDGKVLSKDDTLSMNSSIAFPMTTMMIDGSGGAD